RFLFLAICFGLPSPCCHECERNNKHRQDRPIHQWEYFVFHCRVSSPSLPFLKSLFFRVRMKEFLWWPLVDRQAALTAVNRVAGGAFLNNFGRRGQPLLYVALAVLALLVFYGAHRLARQERMVLAALLSSGLDRF